MKLSNSRKKLLKQTYFGELPLHPLNQVVGTNRVEGWYNEYKISNFYDIRHVIY